MPSDTAIFPVFLQAFPESEKVAVAFELPKRVIIKLANTTFFVKPLIKVRYAFTVATMRSVNS